MCTSAWPPSRADCGSHSAVTACRTPARSSRSGVPKGSIRLRRRFPVARCRQQPADRGQNGVRSAPPELHGAQQIVVPSNRDSRSRPGRLVGPATRRRQSGSRGEFSPFPGRSPCTLLAALKGAIGGSEGEYSRFGGVALNGNIGGSQIGKYSVGGVRLGTYGSFRSNGSVDLDNVVKAEHGKPVAWGSGLHCRWGRRYWCEGQQFSMRDSTGRH